MDTRYDDLAVEFGSLYKLAHLLGVTPNAVYNWKMGKTVPIRHLKRIEQLSEGRITRQQMRPDIFGE